MRIALAWVFAFLLCLQAEAQTNIITSGGGGAPGGSTLSLQYKSGASTFGGTTTSTYNTTTGAHTFTFAPAGGSSGNLNLFYIGSTVLDPPSEVRLHQIVQTDQLTTGNSTASALAFFVQGNIDPGTFTWNNGEHNGGADLYSRMIDSVTWNSGCVNGNTAANNGCPGVAYSAVGVLGYADNAGPGELQHAYTFVAHNPQALHAGGATDDWYAFHTDGGCYDGSTASVCHFLDALGINFSGSGTTTPFGLWTGQVADTVSTATGWIVGTTLYTNSIPVISPGPGLGQIHVGAIVTGGAISAGTQLLSSAPADIPDCSAVGCWAWTINNSQTVGSPGAPIAMTFTHTSLPIFLAQNRSQNINSSYSKYTFSIGTGQPVVDVWIGEGLDNVNSTPGVVMGKYLDFNLNNIDACQMYSFTGGGRASGMACGYGISGAIPDQYNFTGLTLNADTNYYANGTPGATSCAGQVANSVKEGLVTNCGKFAQGLAGYPNIANGWWGNVLATQQSTSAVGVANSYYCTPYLITNPATFAGLGIRIGATSVGNGSLALAGAIYSNAQYNEVNRPGAPIDHGTAAFATGSAASVSVALANTTDAITQSQMIWECVQTFDTTVTYGAIVATAPNTSGYIGSSILANVVGANPVNAVSTTGSTFNTWPTFNNATSWAELGATVHGPLMGLQLSSSP